MELVKIELTHEQALIVKRMLQMTVDNAVDVGFEDDALLAPIKGAIIRIGDAMNRR